MEQKTIACTSCGFSLTTDKTVYFCPSCTTQLKCRHCESDIIPNTKSCMTCGNHVNNQVLSNPLNKIEYEQKGDSKKFSASFTNEIGQNLVDSLKGLFGGANSKLPSPKTANNPFSNSNKPQIDLLKKDVILNNANNYEDAEIVDDNNEKIIEALQQIYRKEGDKLILINQRLKHTSSIDYSIRVTLTLLWAYSFLEKKQVERTLIYDAVGPKNATTYFRKWLAGCDELVRTGKDLFGLSKPGEEAVIQVLTEFMDTSITNGSVEFSKPKQKAGNGKKDKNATAKIEKEVVNGNSGKTKASTPTKRTGKPSNVSIIKNLILEGYFNEKRKITDILTHLKVKKAVSIKNNNLATILSRLVKDENLNRETSSIDNQYEYFK